MRPVLLFAFTLFLSACLMFIVELLVGKLVLPYLGGTPAVWNTCMVFWQALLLAGYYYAHVITRKLPLERQIKVHAFVLLVPLVPLLVFRLNFGGVVSWFPPPGAANPIPWLLAVLTMTIGLPFFAISTTASLLQRWYSETNFRGADDPYFLYAASNLGSMLALFGYPILIEPLGRFDGLGLTTQTLVWIAGYAALAGLILYCGACARRGVAEAASAAAAANPAAAGDADESPRADTELAGPPSTWRKLRWVALAFVPSSLMLGVSTYITTDIAAIPLIWMLPLAIYLLTFILVFSRLPVAVHRLMVLLLVPVTFLVVRGLPVVLSPSWLYIAGGVLMALVLARSVSLYQRLRAAQLPGGGDIVLVLLLLVWLGCVAALARAEGRSLVDLTDIVLFDHTAQIILLHLFGLFVVAMVCHGEMARTRPPSQYLTEFFLLMSLGGVLGGIFNALIAPNIFQRIVEYPLMAVVTCLLLPGFGLDTRQRWAERVDMAWTMLMVVFGTGVSLIVLARTYEPAAALARPVIRFAQANLPEPFSSSARDLLGRLADDRNIIFTERNFFGYFSINEDVRHDDVYHSLKHGTTTHGVQCMTAGRRDQPLAYFHRTGPVGQLFEALYARQQPLHVAVLGVGTGTLAAYMKPGWSLDLYEIDPVIVDVARDPRYFTFISDCEKRGVHVQVALGDGRLKIGAAPAQAYDVLVIDVFTSDAVPVHLLTLEAYQLYLSKLKPDGVLVVNIANRYLDFEPVLANLAKACDLEGRVSRGPPDMANDRYGSHWVVLTRHLRNLGPLLQYKDDAGEPAWTKIEPTSPDAHARFRRAGVWTDSYSNLWGVLRW